MKRVLITGHDHPHKGATGTVAGELVRVAGAEMAKVDLDTPSLGSTSCYAEAVDLLPLAPDYQEAT